MNKVQWLKQFNKQLIFIFESMKSTKIENKSMKRLQMQKLEEWPSDSLPRDCLLMELVSKTVDENEIFNSKRFYFM